MAVRSTMATLIAEIRLMINDPSAVIFSDQQIQDELDRNREDIRYRQAEGVPTIAPDGTLTWQDYYGMAGSVGLGDWEADAVLVGTLSTVAFSTLTPTTSDYIVGHWTFSANQLPPVYIIGKTYDRYMSAANLLEYQASTLMSGIDFSTDRQSFKYGQQYKSLLSMAERFKMQARPKMLQAVRNDVPKPLLATGNYDLSRTSF